MDPDLRLAKPVRGSRPTTVTERRTSRSRTVTVVLAARRPSVAVMV
jgi:hypothetical protein